MKKLKGFIKAKERDEKSGSNKNIETKESKTQQSAPPHEQSNERPRELFWDDYSDLGYC